MNWRLWTAVLRDRPVVLQQGFGPLDFAWVVSGWSAAALRQHVSIGQLVPIWFFQPGSSNE